MSELYYIKRKLQKTESYLSQTTYTPTIAVQLNILMAILCCHFLDFSVGVGALVIVLRQISSFSVSLFEFAVGK